MNRSVCIVAILIGLSGCSSKLSEEEEKQALACLVKISVPIKLLKDSGNDVSPPEITTYAQALQESRSRQYWLLTTAHQALQPGNDPHAARAWLKDYEMCGSPTVSIENPTYLRVTGWEDRKNESVLNSIYEANAAFDAAQNDILKDYAKKATSHETSSSAGVRIDTYQMKDGSFKICTTTVRGGGKAVSCH